MEYERLGIGNTAEILNFGEGKICKLFRSNYPKESVKREYDNLKIANQLGIPCPHVYELVEINGRFGVVEDLLKGETILSKIKRRERVDELMNTMVEIQEKMISRQSTLCMSYKDFLRECVYGKVAADDIIYQEIDELPEDDYICHGDYHPDNVLIDEDNCYYVIDFMNLCKGPKLYDVARTYFLISKGEMPRNMSAEDQAQLVKMQRQLGKMYLDKIRIQEEQLQEYLHVIEKCRVYEIQS